jgi:hypothetical protein
MAILTGMKRRVWPLWLALLIVVSIGTGWIAFPTFYIMPFKPQATLTLQWALYARTWAPVVTASCAAIAMLVAIWTIVRSRRWWTRALVVLPLVPVIAAAWFARQNHFEWMFNPLGTPELVAASKASFVHDDDVVMAVKIKGQAVAYPILQLAYHHVANDIVAGEPIVATY